MVSLESFIFIFHLMMAVLSLKIFYEEKTLKEGRKMFYLTMHSTPFIYGYIASDIWQRTTQIVRDKERKEGRICFI